MDFFTQLQQLRSERPRLGLLQLQTENSEFTHCTDKCKNCYLIANAVGNEDCMYGRDLYDNKDCLDCAHIKGCTLTYEALNCQNCYDCSFIQDCENSQNINFGYDLRECKNCTGCAGLRHKKYHIFNEPYSKEDYFKTIKTLSQNEIKRRFEEVELKTPRVYAHQVNAENFMGDYVYNSQNIYNCFDIYDCQDVANSIESKTLKDCYDITILEGSSLCYDISSSHNLYNCNYCYLCADSSDLEYCELVVNSKNCFGCISLNHKEFHILNEPYSEQDYFKKVAEIKAELRASGEYGRRFLPSTFPLEDTVAVWDKM